MTKFTVDETFSNIDFEKETNASKNYEHCTFSGCNFANANLRDIGFEDCSFDSCDFSNAVIVNTAFKNVRFKHCKLIGLLFDTCNPFLLEFTFSNCMLNYTSFYKVKLPKTTFRTCMMLETDFTGADLRKSTVEDCNLSGAVFSNSDLRQSDFRNSHNISLNPEQNSLSGARFSMESLPGLLQAYNIVVD